LKTIVLTGQNNTIFNENTPTTLIWSVADVSVEAVNCRSWIRVHFHQEGKFLKYLNFALRKNLQLWKTCQLLDFSKNSCAKKLLFAPLKAGMTNFIFSFS